MPYKNMVQQKEYQREWYRRKKLGLPTRFRPKPILSEGERRRRKNESCRRIAKRRRSYRRQALVDAFGDSCFICGYNHKRSNLFAHRKDGCQHKDFTKMKIVDFERAIKSNDYVMLCAMCHKLIHFSMKYFNMTWNEIEQRLAGN